MQTKSTTDMKIIPILLLCAIGVGALNFTGNADLDGLLVPFDGEIWNENDAIRFSKGITANDNILSQKELADFTHEADNLFSPFNPKEGIIQPVGQFMYCAVYGVTPMSTQFWGADLSQKNNPEYSEMFQQLPTNIYVHHLTKQVSMTSYINNLDPRAHLRLYKCIETLLSKSVPLFEFVLGKILSPPNTISLRGRRLQVIIGIRANYLNLEESFSTFPGGVWHTEGMGNERIVASSVFYFHVENIHKSKLGFRLQLNGKREFKELESIDSMTNRMIVFPNLVQHNVLPFELENRNKTGRRMAVTVSLVDPAKRILSTGDVAPQQEAWYPINYGDTGPVGARLFPKCDGECFQVSEEQAKSYREMAINERKVILPHPSNTGQGC